MVSNGGTPSTVGSRRRWITGPALVIACLFLAVHAFWLATRPALGAFNDASGDPGVPLAALPLVVPTVVAFLLFLVPAQSMAGFALLSAGALALIASAWHFDRPGRGARCVLACGSIAVLALPLTVRYPAPMVADPGHTLYWPTAPGGMAGVTKRLVTTMDGSPCAYSLLEWGADGALYYLGQCGGRNDANGAAQVWAFHPGRSAAPRKVDSTPSGVTISAAAGRETRMQGFDVRKLSGASRSDDRHPDASAIHAGPELASPDGSWLAVVVAMDYRPTDVVVVSR